MFTADDPDTLADPPMAHLLPSSLREVWDSPRPPPDGRARPPSRPAGPRSAPTDYADATFHGEVDLGPRSKTVPYYYVEFAPGRAPLFTAPAKLRIGVGDYVLTDADRGVDVGRVIALVPHPPPREARSAKTIMRLATQHEIEQLPRKLERERHAVEIGQAKVAESGLRMEITAAEFQFDGKKLTFYYSAAGYIDFRELVRSLFKVFATRIWMVCNDPAPQDDTKGGQ
jgi:hypothetical protein